MGRSSVLLTYTLARLCRIIVLLPSMTARRICHTFNTKLCLMHVGNGVWKVGGGGGL
jgi:hypothetical protein